MLVLTLSAALQDKCHPQTIAVCQSRADGLGLKVLVSSEEDFQFDRDVSGILLQYPATDGAVHDYKVSAFIQGFSNYNYHAGPPARASML